MSGTENPTTTKAPVFKIDLSKKPEIRYRELALAYRDKLHGLTTLFNDLLGELGVAATYHGPINTLARLLLRRLNSEIETEELRGISKITGVPMYLLVAFNVVLDLLMGCTSGAVRSLNRGQAISEAKMLHFRTLDWTMDPLRSVIIQLEFVRSTSAEPTAVLARSITYCGFVGVLTGVRKRLSLSLNFRAVHNASTRAEHFRFYLHHLLVLVGYRPSIPSILRRYLFSEDAEATQPGDLATITEEMSTQHTTAAYLTFCDGISAIVLEKDFDSAKIRSSSTFIAATNHDEVAHRSSDPQVTPAGATMAAGSTALAGLEELLEESRERLGCISSKWESQVRNTKRRLQRGTNATSQEAEEKTTITENEVIQWVSAYPTTNEQTHFAAIMDAATGAIVWNQAYAEPLDVPDED